MSQIFNSIKVQKPTHSRFDMSYDSKLSLKMGELVPCHLQECVPGDHFRMASEAMFRMMPMVAPIMHKVDIYFHSFFVPNRLLWKNWSKFITGGQPGDAPVSMPLINIDTVAASSLANYLGLPVIAFADQQCSALPFMAYQLVWHEFYRDQNLQTDTMIELQDGVQDSGNTAFLKTMRKRAWEHDYFTSALPFAQKGDAVEMPISFDNASIVAQQPTGNNPLMRNSTNGLPLTGNAATTKMNINSFGSTTVDETGIQYPGYYDPQGTLQVTGTAGTTINELRSATALQRWLEKAARGGSRLKEMIRTMFGVDSSDKSLDRPEYIGGSKGAMAISEVLQTSSSDGTSPQANMAGHGISVNGGNDYSYYCEEHGFIITMLSIRPKTSYYNGLPRIFWKTDRFDFYWPDFAQLGEQPVYNGELVYTGAVEDSETWGYLPRYTEYRFNQSRVAGQMATTLEFWHMGRKFDNLLAAPPLNDEFIECDPTKRIFAVEDPAEDEIIAHIYHKIQARRPIPQYGTPGII